ncbi:PREDICTED: uncharacterized protein LOC104595379 isoform X2 [Nelumbo nucifera]|uniref:BSD2 cysteine rich domain-containing protein n=2 Tax=Nelumbo nucifera TaxID=4432 RepID=A0A822Y7I0_NELNU|nr:PREDICTED: uncharacterized protein LOC104595379 isoform X2 [Nelumbo nucifera]DAD27156.1 TPA_asm: hypothetical protein HUJ06_028624 [Nelumbo nucifera]
MANALCFSPAASFKSPSKPGLLTGATNGREVLRVDVVFRNSRNARLQSIEVKAADSSNQSTKSKSIVCADCDGNGAVLCSQCKGTGVNSVDHFNGQFKAGGLCWLCRGKKEILCGNCNGAGFVGGFMSSFDS